MAKRKPQPEPFDVADFLRPADTDLRSALASLLGDSAPGTSGGGTKLGPGPMVRGASDESVVAEGAVNLGGGPSLAHPGGGPTLGGDSSLGDAEGGSITGPGVNLTGAPVSEVLHLVGESGEAAKPAVSLEPGLNLTPPFPSPLVGEPSPKQVSGPISFPAPPPITGPGPNLAPPPSPKPRTFPIREAKLAQDGHTRVEQLLYETLWERAKPHDEVSRLITVGFAGMARLVRLSESNARINLRSLIQKLAVEEYSTYNCEQSLGRTYRVFNYGEILKRRREAGLVWYMRKTLAVLFVDPNTGEPLVSKPKPQKRDPGLNLTGSPDPNLAGASGPMLGGGPGPNLPGLYRESVENLSRELSAAAPLLYEHLSQYGHADDDAIRRLFLACKRNSADCTVDEIGYFIHQKAAMASRMPLHNAIGFLITAVPKCFAGEAFQAFRAEQRKRQEALEAQRRREEAELAQWRAEQQALLQDPTVPEEDKVWIRKILQ